MVRSLIRKWDLICSTLPVETVSLDRLCSLFQSLQAVGGKCGFVWGGTALFCLIVAYFFLPEYKNR